MLDKKRVFVVLAVTMILVATTISPATPATKTTWSKTYGGTNHEEANCVQETSDNGYIVAGITMSFGAGQGDFRLFKLDASGGGTGLGMTAQDNLLLIIAVGVAAVAVVIVAAVVIMKRKK